MPSGFASRGGFVLMRTPNARQQARRRWLTLACAALALAIVSGLIGSLTSPRLAIPISSEAVSLFPAQ